MKLNDQPCPECGRPVPADAPEEVCPACSLQSLLKFISDPAQPEGSSSEAVERSALNPQPGVRFGDYELLELLARGGMGVVYKARQASLNRTVALKMIQSGLLASPAEVKRFHAEAEAIAHLQHPNIVAVHEVGEHEGRHYFSMDYVAGRTLAEVVRDGPLSATRAATYVKATGAAVDYAHHQGVLHRDLKPANVMIDENDQPRITDFGLAKRLNTEHRSLVTDYSKGAERSDQSSVISHQWSDLTVSGQMVGSPNYLPPEQAEPKHGALGPPSDVYALGAILYHLITGRPPFQAESLTTLLRQVIETDPVAPRMLNPSIPRDLETICLKCLEKEPQRRYATAQALADDLGRFLNHEPVLARPVGASGKALRWCRRRPVLASMTGTLALVLVLGISGISWQWRRAERERRTALANEQLAMRQAYAGDMNLVQRSLEEGDLGRARQILEKYNPVRSSPSIIKPAFPTDLRGWEWRYLWGLCRSDDQYTLTQGTNKFRELALAPDGRLLAARRVGGVVELWNLQTRQHSGILTNQWGPLDLAFPAGRHLLASASSDSKGVPQQILRNLPEPANVSYLALSPDGNKVATFHIQEDSRLRVWEMPSGKLLMDVSSTYSFTGTEPQLLFSPDGTTLALGETHGQIRLFHFATGATIKIPPRMPGNGVYALAFSPDSRILASGYGFTDGLIGLWDVSTGESRGRLEGHQGFVTKLVFAPDTNTLYSASFDQSIRSWDVTSKKQTGRLQGHAAMINDLKLFPDGRSLVSCADDGSIRVWDLRAKPRPPASQELPVHTGMYGALFMADSRRLITASPAHLVTIWDVVTGKEKERIAGLGTNNLSVALSRDQRLLAVGALDGTLKIWNLRTQSLVKQWRPYRHPVFGLLFLDGGKRLASTALAPGFQTDLRLWDTDSWQKVAFGPAAESCFGLAQSPDERLLALIYALKPLQVWNCDSGGLKATLGSDGGFTPVFSRDGRFLAAALRQRACVWEVGTWRRVAVLEQPANPTYSVAFSPDGKRLLTGSLVRDDSQPALRVWDYAVERELLRLYSQGPWTAWMEFAPDGNALLAVSWDGMVKLWRAPSWAEIEAAEEAGKAR